jgi:peptidoglycan/LPS O-acetylase OafA/YrhL
MVATLVCAFIVGPLGSEPGKYFSQLDINKLAVNMVRLYEPAVPPVFLGQPHEAVNGSMWTIRFEFLCYLCVLALGAVGVVKHRRIWLFLTAVCVALLLLGKLGFQPSLAGNVLKSGNLFLRLVVFFFSGGVYYLFRKEIAFKARIAWPLAGLLILAMFQMPIAEVALATAGGYLLFYFAFSPIPLLARFQRLPDVSYGLYLYGWPIQKLLIWYFPALSAWSVVLISLFAGLLAGLVSWHVVEKVFLKLKPKRTLQTSRAVTLDIAYVPLDRKI